MKKRRKHKKCLNCEQTLNDNDNYCSNCGQENTDNEVGIGLLIREFTSNFFSLDSRFGRTFKPFLFKPGKITTEFNRGKRVLFANPIRWYLVISIFHFFFFTKVVDPVTSNSRGRAIVINSDSIELTTAEFDSLYYLPDSLHDQDDWPFSGHYMTLIDEMNKADELSHQEILDSLRLNELPWLERQIARQVIKVNHESEASLNQYIVRQIPVIMFFLLPLYALILKAFFWRKGLYIKHLIHSFHIHSFFFFVLGIAWVFRLLLGEAARNTAPALAFMVSFVYIIISFRKVYQTKWIWLSLKLLFIGLIYLFLLSAVLVLGILISLALF